MNNYNNGTRNNRSYKYRSQKRNNKYRRNRRSFKTAKIPIRKYISTAEKHSNINLYVDDKYCRDFNVCDTLLKNIENKKYINPTQIQEKAIDLILDGNDILGLASTGSGKTGAFLIPLIELIANGNASRALIIAPTRELAGQIYDELYSLTKGLKVYSTLIVGGVNIYNQIKKLRRKPHFVVGTPGRLKDLIDRNELRLDKFDKLVIDEVDRMLDMGFIDDIEYIVNKMQKVKQTLLFSATLDKKTEEITKKFLHNPIRIQVNEESPLKSINQDIVKYKSSDDKLAKLLDLLNDRQFKKVLIFTQTKRDADNLAQTLYKSGIYAESIHGDKSQYKRNSILRKFKEDKCNVLVATDVAARGLDIKSVTHVINYDEPNDYQTYIHRIGRTGRAGAIGNALTFVNR